ncbi:general odorant-binding protein 56a-like isoform X2 [Belonocnema kinseyi]|uniref:general odorant-binding protein 56a-like isoform X2 n=1 Tax=Belonocnema kinseyi TaxID=2817044 RepID=UPI00143DB775|nr:general odorant-binding protein 56a-like isoform X2 [Belonocnema kinseyi]
MKTFSMIFGLCIAGILAESTDPKRSDWEVDRDDCIKESGIEPVVVEKIAYGHFVENDEKQGCFAACMAKKKGLMNSDGSINESKLNVRGSVSKERADVIINKCKVIKGADDCETARKVINCMYEEDGWYFSTILLWSEKKLRVV